MGFIAAPWSFLCLLVVLLFLGLTRTLSILLVAALLIGASTLALRELSLKRHTIQQIFGEEINFRGTVMSDPAWSKPTVRGSQFHAPSMTFLARVQEIQASGVKWRMRAPIRVIVRGRTTLIPGNVFVGEGKLLASKERRVLALVILNGQPTPISQASTLMQATTGIRHRFSELSQSIAGDSGALIPGLVLGDTSRESAQFTTEMRRVGLTHLTAVSGENFAIIAATMLWLTQWIFRKRRARLILTALVLIGFIFLVRPSPSVLRASVMTGVLLMAKARGSEAEPLASLGFAIGILILLDPFQALDAGFALSVAATAGILLLSPHLSIAMQERGVAKPIAEFLAIPVSATAFCTPVIVAISGQVSLVSIPANLLVTLVVAPITIGGFIAALLPALFGQVAHLLLVTINPCAEWIVWVAHHGSQYSVLLLPKSALGVLIVTLVVVSVLARTWKALFSIVGIVGLLLIFTSTGWPGKHWSVVACDVGQGDGMVINLGEHRAIVIDAGPDADLMRSCLRSLKIKIIPLLVLTHFHADHVEGLAGILRTARVESVWISNSREPAGEYGRTLELLKGVTTSVVHQGQHVKLQNGEITVMWPRIKIEDFDSLPGDGSAINNSSVALLITLGKLSLFTTVDIEPPAQAALLQDVKLPHVLIYKVPHHGSAYQDWDLVDALRPALAIISVGADNSYGHPSPKTLAALAERGIAIRRTDRDGAISIDERLRIRVQKRAWWKISWG